MMPPAPMPMPMMMTMRMRMTIRIMPLIQWSRLDALF